VTVETRFMVCSGIQSKWEILEAVDQNYLVFLGICLSIIEAHKKKLNFVNEQIATKTFWVFFSN
jgi:hypothetical protein